MDDFVFEVYDEFLEYFVEFDMSSKLDGFVERGELLLFWLVSVFRFFVRIGSLSRV